jgi:hypothetical protein
MQADTSLAEEGTGGVMDEPPRDPPTQPEPTEPAAPVTPVPEPAPEPEPESAEGWIPSAPAPASEPIEGWIPPADNKSSRIVIRVLAAIAVVVAGALVFTIVIGGSSDPHDKALKDFGERLAALPEFEARYGDVESGDEAFQRGQQLGAAGLARLPDDRLLRYWQLSNEMLALADDADCAALIRQTAKGTDAASVVRRLEIDEFREMLEITYTAVEAELKDTPGPPAPKNADIEAASVALAGAMGADTVVGLGTTLSDITAEDAAVCGAARSFVAGILDLGEPHRSTFLRYMVAQGL